MGQLQIKKKYVFKNKIISPTFFIYQFQSLNKQFAHCLRTSLSEGVIVALSSCVYSATELHYLYLGYRFTHNVISGPLGACVETLVK